jgi:hypothetical protein
MGDDDAQYCQFTVRIYAELERNAIHLTLLYDEISLASNSQQVDYCHQDRGNNDPEELKPVKKRDADELRLRKIVERRPEHGDEGKKHEQ